MSKVIFAIVGLSSTILSPQFLHFSRKNWFSLKIQIIKTPVKGLLVYMKSMYLISCSLWVTVNPQSYFNEGNSHVNLQSEHFVGYTNSVYTRLTQQVYPCLFSRIIPFYLDVKRVYIKLEKMS